jgi:hypothetical protein
MVAAISPGGGAVAERHGAGAEGFEVQPDDLVEGVGDLEPGEVFEGGGDGCGAGAGVVVHRVSEVGASAAQVDQSKGSGWAGSSLLAEGLLGGADLGALGSFARIAHRVALRSRGIPKGEREKTLSLRRDARFIRYSRPAWVPDHAR